LCDVLIMYTKFFLLNKIWRKYGDIDICLQHELLGSHL